MNSNRSLLRLDSFTCGYCVYCPFGRHLILSLLDRLIHPKNFNRNEWCSNPSTSFCHKQSHPFYEPAAANKQSSLIYSDAFWQNIVMNRKKIRWEKNQHTPKPTTTLELYIYLCVHVTTARENGKLNDEANVRPNSDKWRDECHSISM